MASISGGGISAITDQFHPKREREYVRGVAVPRNQKIRQFRFLQR
jgi:hypothetical protein